MRCPSCGFANGDGMHFCGRCGTKLPTPCLACGFANPADHVFCGRCGGRLPAPTLPPSPASSAERRPPEAERRQLTVLFCDLVGSTALSERLDPEDLRNIMQAYQQASRDVIERYEGHVAQYLGDGLMVYFGWPRAHEDDAVRAIRAGLEVTHTVSKLSVTRPMSARVGIHTGLVVVGETGQGDASIPKAAVGDTPNIAARLQALAEPGAVVVSARTRALAKGLFEYGDLGLQSLKGLSEPVALYRVIGTRSIQSRFDASHGGIALTPLVGREEEIALLLRRWEQAREGEGQVVLLGGEPGIGKSRLTLVLRDHVAGQSCPSLRFQCSPYHLNSALYPIIAQFEHAAGFTREDTPEQKLDKMEALLAGSEAQRIESAPLFAGMMSLPLDRYPPLNLTPQKQKEKTLEALARQVEALAQREPLLIIYEDAHWIDPTSQEALDLLVPRLQRLPVLLVVTYRPEYIPKWAEQAHISFLGLNRLSRRQGSELVNKITRGKPLPIEVLDQILAHTDGVPLFVEELTKSVLESKLLTDAGDHYTLQGPLPALAIPTTLRDSLIARLDRLSPIREIAQIGACIGREFSYELLALLAPIKGPRLEEALEQLTGSGLVFRRGNPPDTIYTFKHALVQDAAYDSLLRSKRAQLHAQIAKAIEAHFPEIKDTEPELLAQHYTAAGLIDEAIAYWRKAGELALRRVELKEAIAHLTKGLDLIGTLAASKERDQKELALRTILGTAWIALGGWASPQAEASFSVALVLARSLNHRPSYLPVLYGLYVYHIIGGCIAESFGRVREMKEVAEALDDPELSMAEHMFAQCSNFYSGELEESLRHGDRIAELYNDDQGRHIEHLTNQDPLTGRGLFGTPCLWMLGYPDKAVELYTATEMHARARGHPFGLSWVLTYGPWVFDMRGESDRALPILQEGVRLGQTHGIPLFSEVIGPIWIAIAWIRTGRLAEGIAQLSDGIAKWNSFGCHLAEPYFKSALAEGIARSGDIDQGLHLIDECLEMIKRPGWQERVQLAEVLRLKGSMLQQRGKLAEAEQTLRSALDVARGQQAKSWELRSATSLARIWQDQGKGKEAWELLAPVYNWFTEGFDTRDLQEAKALLAALS